MLTMVGAVVDNSKVMYCIPIKVVEWRREDLFRTTTKCLDNNFVHEHGDVDDWADAYMDALEANRQADREDQNLISVRRELMLTLRETQVKTTHHKHAIEKCASLANKMPHHIAENYANEMEITIESIDLWLHHARQDLRHCSRLLHDIVERQQQHMKQHLVDDHVIFQTQLKRAEHAREIAQQKLNIMLAKRDTLIAAHA